MMLKKSRKSQDLLNFVLVFEGIKDEKIQNNHDNDEKEKENQK